jgi:hypothetical protein
MSDLDNVPGTNTPSRSRKSRVELALRHALGLTEDLQEACAHALVVQLVTAKQQAVDELLQAALGPEQGQR